MHKAALTVHMKNGLHVQRGGADRYGCVDPSAALEEAQIVHGKPVAQMGNQALDMGNDRVQAEAFADFFRGQIYQEPFAQSGAAGIQAGECAGWITPCEFAFCVLRVIVCGTEHRREAEIECVAAFFQDRGDLLQKCISIDGGCESAQACAQILVKASGVVCEIFVLAAGLPCCHRQGQHSDTPFANDRFRQIAG